MKLWCLTVIGLIIGALFGCSNLIVESEASIADAAAAQPEATLNPIFSYAESATRIVPTRTPPSEATTSTLYVDIVATEVQMTQEAPPLPTPTSTPPPTPIPTLSVETLEQLYDDTLHPNWEIVTNADYELDYDLNPYSGSASIVFTPTLGARTFLFTVKDGADRQYRRDEIFGITFQVSSINNHIGLDDMAMTVIGSNTTDHWEMLDLSVENVGIPNESWIGGDDRISNWYATVYPETLIGFLEVDRAIAPKVWTPVNNWLPARTLLPDFEYVTGFYIKVATLWEGTIQIDDIRIIALDEALRQRLDVDSR